MQVVAKVLNTRIPMSNTMTIMDQSEPSPLNLIGSIDMNPYEIVSHLVSSNAVVVFSMSSCCMCTVAKRLLFGLGVGPTIIELDHHASGHDIKALLFQLLATSGGSNAAVQQPVPAVFVGGKFLGSIETLMACHINGTLVPLLKDAGALWL
ncbi:hypothetical protein ACFE04_013451 [Oxalis oulophora]